MQEAFQTDSVKPRQHSVAGALAFKLTPTTRLDFDAEYSYRDQVMYPGLAVPDPMNARSANRLSVKNFYGESVDKFKGELKLFTGRITQELNEDWSINAGYSKNFTTRKPWQIILTGLDSTGLEVNREAYDYSQKYDIDTAQTELKGKFNFFGTRHRVTFLVDAVRQSGKEFPNDGLLVGPVDLYNPRQTGSEIDPLTVWEGWKFKSRDYGISVQDYIEITPWLNLLAGVRRSNFKEISPGMSDQKGSSTDPTAGIIIKPFPWMSLYSSYSSSSAPNVGILTGPDSFAPPSEAKQYEIGAKAEWLGGALRTSISYFHLTKTNVPTPALNPLFSEISGEVRAKGWELEAVGQLTHRWNVLAGFAIVDATITKDNTPTNVGNKLPDSPRTSGSLWSTYDLSGFAEGWTLGGGIFYTGRKHVAEDNLVKLPPYTIADAMVSYRFKSLLPGARIQLNLRNIFDKRHYQSGQSNENGFTALFPGLPRTVSASLTIPF
jgi:iron complex outermembrane receptor protein